MAYSLNLENLSAGDIGELVRHKKVSPVEVARYFADRIEKRNDSINAFVYTRFDYAFEAAKAIEKKLYRGEDTGVFSGVPFAMKDFLPSKTGWTNTHGGVKALSAVDEYDSVFTAAMERAGGIAIGKTNAPAFGFRGTTDNKMYGPTGTPFNTQYNSGGSSGGSAAAVADGLVPIAEGGDAGGSIRIPAAWCGLVGFKASSGLIPNVSRPDAFCATHPFCTPGGLMKSVKDAALLFDLMKSYDARDPYSVRFEKKAVDCLEKSIKGLRIAFTADFGSFEVDEEVSKIVYNAAKAFEDAGAVVEDIKIRLPRSANEYAKIWNMAISFDTAVQNELNKKHGFDLIRDHADDLPDEFIYWNNRAVSTTLMDLYNWNLAKTELFDAHRSIFEKYDLIISPTTSCLPVKNSADRNTLGPALINGKETERLIGFCQTFYENILGNPACSVPAGLTDDNLPVGMQIIGDRLRDDLVLNAASIYEKINPWKDNYSIAFERTI